MKTVVWQTLDTPTKNTLLQRPAQRDGTTITESVKVIIQSVQNNGDDALKVLTERFDNVQLGRINVSAAEVEKASIHVSAELKQAMEQAYNNIFRFHSAQQLPDIVVETQPGVTCEQLTRPVHSVGLYIPGGSASLPSTVLMLGIPARIAGCKRVVLCTPPPVSDATLYAAKLCGITDIYCVGGAQAIAAMAYGTESIGRVDKIFGPGNAYVTEAKRQVSTDASGAAIDMPAGPSEVMVIADSQADPNFIAADLLSQAEHGSDSQVILVTPSSHIIEGTVKAIDRQLESLPRAIIANAALDNSLLIQARDMDECIAIANQYGPEHLIVQTEHPRTLLPSLDHAGSIFLGRWSPESAGDYASGTNHVLPTYGFTRTSSSLGLSDFIRRMTVQELTEDGLKAIAATVTTLAEAEGLDAHKQAVIIRMNTLNKK